MYVENFLDFKIYNINSKNLTKVGNTDFTYSLISKRVS